MTRGSLAAMAPTGRGEGPLAQGGKSEQVRAMFSDIAPTYDLLNSLLSFGIDRRWRAEAARAALGTLAPPADPSLGAHPQQHRVLDVATGTGDLASALKRLRPDSEVVGVDFAEPMLARARIKAQQRGLHIEFLSADGTQLPFDDASFDAVTIGYGLRNFADPGAGLREFRRVLRPGGKLAVLEFPPPPRGVLGAPFRIYFTKVLPALGGLVSGRRSAYSYLPESVLAFFTPVALERLLTDAGFTAVNHRLQTFGVSALHVAERPRDDDERRKP